jgi:hypothetical protein
MTRISSNATLSEGLLTGKTAMPLEWGSSERNDGLDDGYSARATVETGLAGLAVFGAAMRALTVLLSDS